RSTGGGMAAKVRAAFDRFRVRLDDGPRCATAKGRRSWICPVRPRRLAGADVGDRFGGGRNRLRHTRVLIRGLAMAERERTASGGTEDEVRRRRRRRHPDGGRRTDMKAFAQLYVELDQTNKTNDKVEAMRFYFEHANPGDAAWAFYFLSGRKPRQIVPSARLRAWGVEQAEIPEWLFLESRDTVGDTAETIALLLPAGEGLGDT